MSNTELSATIRELRELRRMADELAAEIETLTDAVKEHMTAAGVDTLAGTDYKVTWRDVSSRRLLTPRRSNATTRNCTASTAAKPFRNGLPWRDPLDNSARM